jgi:hypothetical protein
MPFGQQPEYANLVYISLQTPPVMPDDISNKAYVDGLTNPPGADGSVIVSSSGQLATVSGFAYDTNTDTLFVENAEVGNQLTLDADADFSVTSGTIITNLATPVLGTDAANKAYLDTKYGIADGDLDMAGNKIINLSLDSSAASAVPKSYVDANLTKANYSAVVTPTAGVGYNTVGAAVLAGEKTIFVRAGTYTETGPIALSADVSIIGEDKEQCILNFSTNGFTLAAPSVTGNNYATGTIAMTNGSTTVTGTGTTWTGFSNTLFLRISSNYGTELYPIASFNSATSLTLATTYRGVSFTGQAYTFKAYTQGISLQNLTIQTSAPSNDVISLNSALYSTIENINTVGRVSIAGGFDSRIRDCSFEGSTSTAGCILSDFSKGLVENVSISGSTTIGLKIDSSTNTRVDKCTFSDNGADGLEVSASAISTNLSFVSCTFLRNAGRGALLLGLQESLFMNCSFEQSGSDAVRIGSGASVVQQVALNGCAFLNSVGAGVHFHSNSLLCEVTNGKFDTNTQGVLFNAATPLASSHTIRNCHIQACSSVAIDNTAAAGSIQIIDSDISGGSDHGIIMLGKYCHIAGCSVVYGSGTSKVGIDCRVPGITLIQESTMISSCKVADWTSYGIIGNSQMYIDSCTIDNVGDAAVFVGNNSRIIGCTLYTMRASSTAAYIVGSGSSISACVAGPGLFPSSESPGNFRFGIALATDFAITTPSSNCICMGNVVTGAREIGIYVPGNTATELSINANRVANTGGISGVASVGISLNGTTGMIVNGNAVNRVRALTTFNATGILLGSSLVSAVVTGNLVRVVTVVSGTAATISDLGTTTIGLSPQTNDVSLS